MSAAIIGLPAYVPQQLFSQQEDQAHKEIESHLRSARVLFGYQVNALEGDVGTLTDFIVDDEDWDIRYMVVDISSWLGSEKQVLVALEWASNIDIAREEVLIDLSQDAVKFSPAFDPNLPVNRQYEEVIYDYYGRPKYWQLVEE